MRGRKRFRRAPLPPPDVQRARLNEQIRVPRILLIDEEGTRVGEVRTDDARARAVEKELDLVEVAPDANPPVCRIMNYGKFLFEQQKKERANNRKKSVNETKEVRLRPGTDKGDMAIKAKHAREFLEDGYKVGIQLLFRGREQAHPEMGVEKIKEFAALLDDISKIEQMPRKEGRRMNAILAPKTAKPSS